MRKGIHITYKVHSPKLNHFSSPLLQTCVFFSFTAVCNKIIFLKIRHLLFLLRFNTIIQVFMRFILNGFLHFLKKNSVRRSSSFIA